MPLLVVLLSVLLLLLLIYLKFPPVLALLAVAISAGLMQGMELNELFRSIEQGIGNTLGSIAMVIVLGAMFGKLIEVSGAAQRITQVLLSSFGNKNIQWAMMLTGFIVGLPLFYNAGFVILVPLVFSVAASANLPLLYVGIPLAASLSVTHGFLPPHPGPMTIAPIFKADVGKTLLFGLVISVPTVILAGPLFSKSLGRIKVTLASTFKPSKMYSESEMPSTLESFAIALLPVFFIGGVALIKSITSADNNFLRFMGEPLVALFISLLLASYFLGIKRGQSRSEIAAVLVQAVSGVAMIILITGSGGAFKQVLVNSGVSQYITSLARGLSLSPLFLAWLIAAMLRVSIGSATVAALTAAGIVAPMAMQGVSAELMVLAVGSGSLMFSHVNDTGFWMFKEYFNLSVPQTLASWSVMETIISISGIIGVLTINSFI
jgi:gluconate transporter